MEPFRVIYPRKVWVGVIPTKIENKLAYNQQLSIIAENKKNPNEAKIRNSRVILDGKMLHTHRPRCPLVVVCEPFRVEDFDHGRDRCGGHEDEVL